MSSSRRLSVVEPVSSERALPSEIRVIKPDLEGGSGDGQKLFVVGFDPGVRTGWCVMRINYEELLRGGISGVSLSHPDPEVFSFSSGYFEGPEPYQAELMMALLRGTWMHGEGVWNQGSESDMFVCSIESFTLREFSTDDSLLSPVRVTAMFRSVSWRTLFVPVVSYSPSDAMAVFTDHVLRSLNLWSGPDGKLGEHQRDATRHAGLAARKMVDRRWASVMVSRMKWMSE